MDNKLHRRDMRNIGLIILLALAHGLTYVFLMPPWQHYDEPNHFEYVWMVANWNRLPEWGENDSNLSRQVLQSMIAHQFYKPGQAPDLPPEGQPVNIPGFPQLGDPPVYYILASLPLRLMHSAAVESQLYAARLVSLLIFLITVCISWFVARELTTDGHPLRWMLPASLVFLPAFVDLMTAVNSDSAGVAVFSLFLWGSIRFLRERFNIFNLGWVVVAAGLTYFTKNTAAVALVILPLVIVFGLLRGKARRFAWLGLGIAAIAGLVFGILWDDALYWYSTTTQETSVRQSSDRAVVGTHVFRIEAPATSTPVWLPPLFQPLSPEVRSSISGKAVTFGAWIWASQPVTISTPPLSFVNGQSYAMSIDVDQTPGFFAWHAVMPEGSWRGWLALDPKLLKGSASVTIYYDGLVMVKGKRPLDFPPIFSTPDGLQGKWGEKKFVNLIRNPSGEAPGPRIDQKIDLLAARYLPDRSRPTTVGMSLLDWRATSRWYLGVVKFIFRTFWARFGWAHVPLLGSAVWRYLLIVTILGLVGSIVAAIRYLKLIPWEIVVIFGLALILSWGATITRGVIYLGSTSHYTSVARHSYPLIIPVMFILTTGWQQLFSMLELGWCRLVRKGQWLSRWELFTNPKLISVIQAVIFIGLFLYLDIQSLISIIAYYGEGLGG
jgi:hypothetical protein